MNRARSIVYRSLSRLFRRPDRAALERLQKGDLPLLSVALHELGADSELIGLVGALSEQVESASLEELQTLYHDVFEPSGGLRCPPNETSQTPESPQEAMTKTFQLADIAGFYRAFGVEIAEGEERVDHIAAELEFLHLLATKEAFAERQGREERAAICRDAERSFLRDHLACWTEKLSENLEEAASGTVYATAGRLLRRFVEIDLSEIGPREREE
ncbi:MAG: TorD/DmsD family molecular chaperone [Vicinamibacteria bacterium]